MKAKVYASKVLIQLPQSVQSAPTKEAIRCTFTEKVQEVWEKKAVGDMAAITWVLLIYISIASSQILRQYRNTTIDNQGICRSKVCATLSMFQAYYKDCIVVLGTLRLALLEKATKFLVVYRIEGLTSLGRLFPNLARIRGEKLLNNYALIIGLYGLLKIDRGGVLVWGTPKACFIETVDWRTIVPVSRLVISPQDRLAHCNFPCTCSLEPSVNHCWNNMKCQIYLEGKEADKCHDQCLGCRKTRSYECSLCRYYTHNGKCVSKCPSNTIILPNTHYCITNEECDNLDGWVWNNTIILPNTHYCITNEECDNLDGWVWNNTCTCEALDVWAVGKAQEAEGCVFINGSLEIHIRPVPEVMAELTTYLNRIQEVSDYVAVYSSSTITSLDFLSSLKRIKGRNLKHGQYSLLIHNMANLQTLFTPNVTHNLKIDRGTLKIYDNPMLCKSQIDVIKPLFPVQPNKETDIPTGMNGYSGGCEDGVGFQIRIVNETSVVIMFPTLTDLDAHYSVLYVRLPLGTHQTLVPETCSDSEWYAVNVETSFGHQFGVIELTSLRPASTYAICIETYDPVHKILARSTISNFTTPVGKPEPPFIKELVASNSVTVDVRWVDHRDYLPFISHYELDVSLLEIYENDIAVKDQCKYFEYNEFHPSQHALLMKPPPEYARYCESCGISSNVTAGEIVEEHFDVCSSIGCDNLEEKVPGNSSFGKYVKTLVLNLTSPRKDPRSLFYFQVEGLAPFRDYRFRLRACSGMECSRSARGVVRTLSINAADVPSVVYVNADEQGYISVKWEPPEVTNGPILSFSIEVVPKIKQDSLHRPPPQTWCVLANETSLRMKTVQAKTYSIRVCTRSMFSDGACTEWKSVETTNELPTPTWWWTGIAFAVCLYISSIVAGFIVRKRSSSIDLEPILGSSATLDVSEPPSKMFSDFAPIYEIPLRDTRLE
ncbi:Insulin receptor [Operophtera brumata]|uniref:receptor protein-tyrosine kinase n=1 Tax=Operophtera brumata TaxID=104452 RepID=A0A0L7L922_OPEBR|nr:Insulin receptor [Operophtera brumata]